MPKTGPIMIHDLCKNQVIAGLILLSPSFVYSITPLVSPPFNTKNEAYCRQLDSCSVVGLSSEGIAEDFPTIPPLKISRCA
jgi:hypothetical protein